MNAARSAARAALRRPCRRTARPLAADAAPGKRPARAARRAYLGWLRDRQDAMEVKHGAPTLSAGVIVERTPVVMPDPEDWELAMWELQRDLEKFDGFEWPAIVGGGEAAVQEAEAKKRPIPDEILAAGPPRNTHFRSTPAEVCRTQAMNRETDADRTNDVRSLERRLADSLFLLVRPEAAGGWQLPATDIDTDEFLREAAERALLERCGPDLYTYILGNAPAAVWDVESENGLDRVFYARAIVVDLYTSGPVDPAKNADFAWVTKDEISDYVSSDDPDYLEFLDKVL